jgi:hypothetical protein
MTTTPWIVRTIPKKPFEEMTDKELMAHCMRVKRNHAKMRSKMTHEELNAYYADLRHRMETEYGMKYYTPPSAADSK